MSVTTKEKLEKDGFAQIDNFLSVEECDELTRVCWEIVDGANVNEERTIFLTTGNKQITNKYFMESADKIRFFYEAGAFDESGKLVVEKRHAFNKIAHALHALSPPFRRMTFSDKVKSLLRDIGYVDPVVFQGMCIFKPPKIGSTVTPHQDMSFLHVDTGKLMGLWIALEDAGIDNSCLHFIPGSHKDGVHNNRRMIRIVDGDDKNATTLTAPPCEYDDSLFVAAPVKKGSALLLDGCVVHKSAPNTSDKSRLVYTFHMYDANGSVYSPDNWLQSTESGTFLHLYDTSPEVPVTRP